MRSAKKLFTGLAIIIIASVIMVSCATSEKAAVKCPDFYGSKYPKAKTGHKRVNQSIYAVHRNTKAPKVGTLRMTARYNPQEPKDVLSTGEMTQPDNSSIIRTEPLRLTENSEYFKAVTVSLENEEALSVSNAMHETVIAGIVQEEKKNVAESKKESAVSENYLAISQGNPMPSVSQPTQVEGLAIAGLAIGVVGLIIAGIPLGALAVVFGALSLTKFKRNPDRYMGKGLAIAAIILGLVDIVGALIVIATMV